MDGNGRWAQRRSHSRVWGHIRGAGIVSDIIEESGDLGVEALTLYSFSTENWSRPFSEVNTLFKLLRKFLLKERSRLIKKRIRFRTIGDVSHLPEETQRLIFDLEDATKDLEGLKLTLAFGYGSRSEIVSSINTFIKNNPGKTITEDDLGKGLMNPEAGDVDLMIRTGGDQRISNFLLWQSAYAELFFTKTKWPDFTREEYREIYNRVAHRERRFGNVSSTNSLEDSLEIAKSNLSLIRSGN